MSLKDAVRAIVPRSIWERMRLARIRQHIRKFEPYVAEHVYGGVPLRVQIADGLGRGWYDRDWAALHEIELLAPGRLRPGARVFDCGAHQGVVALMLRDRVLPGGNVIAVEGMQHNCAVARANATLNGAEGEITVVHAAVAAEPGRVKFVDGLNGAIASGSLGTWVDAVTLDMLAERFGPPDVLFIDIEGYECHALRGAARTLARDDAPDCYVEVHTGVGLEPAGSVAEILSFFDESCCQLWAWRCSADGVSELPRRITAAEAPDVHFGLIVLHE